MEEDSICGVSWQSSKNPGEMDQQMWALELGLCSLCCRSPCNSICRKKKSVKKSLWIRLEGGIKAHLELSLVRDMKGSKFSAGMPAAKGRVRKCGAAAQQGGNSGGKEHGNCPSTLHLNLCW